jgi:hypothetical protein
MPNWCSDKLTVIGPGANVQAFKTKAVGHSPWEEPEANPDVLNFHTAEALIAPGNQAMISRAIEFKSIFIGRECNVVHDKCKLRCLVGQAPLRCLPSTTRMRS